MENTTTRTSDGYNASITALSMKIPSEDGSTPTSTGTPLLAAGRDQMATYNDAQVNNDSTPRRTVLDAIVMRYKLLQSQRSVPNGNCGLLMVPAQKTEPQNMKLLKDRYLLTMEDVLISSDLRNHHKHFVDISLSNLKCVDIYTEEVYQCRVINEPFHKVQLAYFNLMQDNCCSDVLGHQLVRSVHEIIPMSPNRTYIIVKKCGEVYEDLHTYIRNKRRVNEAEGRTLFHQICQTVQVCHRNGIILRDLKLKRFYFIDAERTKIQYESLEGAMILDNPDDDTLYDKIGCPLYTAPELLCHNTSYAGKPADMWSLGVILYTILVGQYPFYEKGGCNLLTIIRNCQVQIPLVLSKPIRWLLRNLLRRIPEERIMAEHILLHPWLEEEKPYYMYIPVDAQFSESDEEDSDDKNEKISYKKKYECEPNEVKRRKLDNDSHSKEINSFDYISLNDTAAHNGELG